MHVALLLTGVAIIGFNCKEDSMLIQLQWANYLFFAIVHKYCIGKMTL